MQTKAVEGTCFHACTVGKGEGAEVKAELCHNLNVSATYKENTLVIYLILRILKHFQYVNQYFAKTNFL